MVLFAKFIRKKNFFYGISIYIDLQVSVKVCPEEFLASKGAKIKREIHAL